MTAKLAANVDMRASYPSSKTVRGLRSSKARFKKHDASQQPLFDDFNGELVVVYAEDTDKRTRYLSSSEIVGFERRKIARACGRQPDASDAAHRNAPARCGRIHDHVTRGLWCEPCTRSMASGRGDQIKVNGDIVVAVPAKDVILATGSRDRKNLTAMRGLAQNFAKGNGGLIDTFFVYRQGRFVKFVRD